MYKFVHNAVYFAIRWFFMLPMLVFAMACMITMLPVMMTAFVAWSDDWEEFKNRFVDLYLNMPRDFFRWCVLGE